MEKFLDIVGMNKIALKESANNPNVVNATIGVLKDDNDNLKIYKTIDDIIMNINKTDLYDYPVVDGGEHFKNAVFEWVFKNYKDTFKTAFHNSIIATPGSTGALYLILATCKKNDTVLTSNIGWANYKNLINHNNLNVCEYKLFDKDGFNLNGLMVASNKILVNQDTLSLVINDPCHNPTSYSLSEKEWIELISYLNSLKSQGKKVNLILDIAYIDYGCEKYENSRKNLLHLTKLENHVLCALCFSGSKTFSVYGLRLGALILLSKDKLEDLTMNSKLSARSTWSMAPSIGEKMLVDLCENADLLDKFIFELNESRNVLSNRLKIFLNEATDCKLIHYPVNNGFFVSIPCLSPAEARERLMKMDIHVVPDNGFIRIALSNVPTDKVYGLAKKIYSAMNGLNI